MSVDPVARNIKDIISRERDHARRAVLLLEYFASLPDDQHLHAASALIQELTSAQALLAALKRGNAA